MIRRPGAPNSILTLERALASEWPYDPKHKDALNHPSRMLYADCDYIHMTDLRTRTLRLVLLDLKKLAAEVLKDLDVKHLEVQTVSVWEGGTHSGCVGMNCPVCDWLYYTDYTDGYLAGWFAVIRGKKVEEDD